VQRFAKFSCKRELYACSFPLPRIEILRAIAFMFNRQNVQRSARFSCKRELYACFFPPPAYRNSKSDRVRERMGVLTFNPPFLFYSGVPGVKPVLIELTDFHTKEKVDELEVDAVMVATGRAPFTQVYDYSRPSISGAALRVSKPISGRFPVRFNAFHRQKA
jgi:hypothetical protein